MSQARVTGEHACAQGRAGVVVPLQEGVAMRGVITGRDVVTHLGLIYREFGPGCVARCLWVLLSGRSATFLEVALPPGRPAER